MAKKLFVCLPLEKENLEGAITKQQQAASDMEKQTATMYDVIDYIDADLFGVHPIKSLSKALNSLAEADVAVFLPGWNRSNICKVVRLCADAYRIKVFELSNAQ